MSGAEAYRRDVEDYERKKAALELCADALRQYADEIAAAMVSLVRS